MGLQKRILLRLQQSMLSQELPDSNPEGQLPPVVRASCEWNEHELCPDLKDMREALGEEDAK